MAEKTKRRSRLATALIAGPAVTVGLLGVGAAPVLADNHESGTVCSEVSESALTGLIEAAPETPTQEDGSNVVNIPAVPTSEDGYPAFAYVANDTEYTEATQLNVEGDELTITVTDANPGFCLEEESSTYSWTFDSVETDDVQFQVVGPVVTMTGFPEDTYVTVEVEAPNGNTATIGSPDEDGTLVFDARNDAPTLNLDELEHGPQTLTFSWRWTDENFEQQEESAEVEVTVIPPMHTGEELSTEDLIAALVGDGTVIENIQSIGENFQAGRFSGWDALGIPAGIVLSTGNLLDSWAGIVGYGSSMPSDSLGGDGDEDLDAILESATSDDLPGTTQDAAGLEFSFIPEEANVRFNYVFASDEYFYLESTDEPGGDVSFNDIFAFFVNGQNYALFESEDGETLPVSIENINRVANSDLYNHNVVEDGERPNSGSNVGGYTNVLTFTAPVTPGELNTIKLVIADVRDGSYDSFVVLQGGSFEQVEGPAILDGEFTTGEGEAITEEFEVATNTEDPEWTINVTSDVDEEAGELEIDGTTWTFTPAEGFTGQASFTVTANDGSLNSAPATITITVGEEDDDEGDDTTPPEDGDDTTPPEDDDDDSGDDSSGSGGGSGGEGSGDGSGSDDEGTQDDDESVTPEGAGTEGDDESSDDTAPAGESSDEEDSDGLAKTGLDSAGIGLIAGLLLLIGGGLAVFGYRGRFSRKA